MAKRYTKVAIRNTFEDNFKPRKDSNISFDAG